MNDNDNEIDSSSESDDSYTESLSADDKVDHTDNLDLHGKTLEKFNIISELGTGGYSIVWLAYDVELNRYCAIKVQHPNEYKEGKDENIFMKKLSQKCKSCKINLFNNLNRDFVYIDKKKKFLCSVYDLYAGNLDTFIRNGAYNNGYPYHTAIKMMYQLLKSVHFLHNELNIYHCDIKTDNILIQGYTNKKIIDLYNNKNFINLYKCGKEKYCLEFSKNKNNLKSETKIKIRRKIHNNIMEDINKELHNYDESESECKNKIDECYINDCKIALSDFGNYLDINEGQYYEESFGTRYYRSPENILVGKINYGNDIWAIACTFYELLTGDLLFNPIKDKEFDRDAYHLKLINELCGEYDYKFIKSTKVWKNYFNKSGKLFINIDLNFSNTFDNLKTIVPIEDYDNIIILFKNMFIINPKNRWTCKECIKFMEENLIKI
jgi:serine/threonine-protein kinase SRPK3